MSPARAASRAADKRGTTPQADAGHERWPTAAGRQPRHTAKSAGPCQAARAEGAIKFRSCGSSQQLDSSIPSKPPTHLSRARRREAAERLIKALEILEGCPPLHSAELEQLGRSSAAVSPAEPRECDPKSRRPPVCEESAEGQLRGCPAPWNSANLTTFGKERLPHHPLLAPEQPSTAASMQIRDLPSPHCAAHATPCAASLPASLALGDHEPISRASRSAGLSGGDRRISKGGEESATTHRLQPDVGVRDELCCAEKQPGSSGRSRKSSSEAESTPAPSLHSSHRSTTANTSVGPARQQEALAKQVRHRPILFVDPCLLCLISSCLLDLPLATVGLNVVTGWHRH